MGGGRHLRNTLVGAPARSAGLSGLSGPAHPRGVDPPRDDAIRWDEPNLFTNSQHLPPALMHEPMVVVAERKQVAQIGRPAPRPELQVMRGRPVDRPVAARPSAAPVVCLERPV